ncbi:hypothetical protein FHN55_03025 [Streptomyces sp. NP160]|uniref:hypothetical protein n=1 Tax=Streptomyces sp. NP160 TaxID=2586637 RepID=UPI00111838DF|nr:hypothetical protein [Streptomyces sp. NP160]TNM69314.1 hypothetical protein FHN55_03025 [Streptomyces sp. NP160]
MSVPSDRPRADELREPLTTGPITYTGTRTGAVAVGGASEGAGGSSTTGTAKSEAAGVASEAAEQGKHVAATAGEQASQVASEAGRQAKDLLHQTRSQLTEQTSAGQRQAASGLGALADELKGLAEGRAGSGVATDLVHQASQRVGAVGSWLEEREPADVLREVEGFARRRPVAFLAIAAGVGLLAGRLTRGLGAAAHEQGAPSASSGAATTLPASGTTYASTTGAPLPATTPVRPAPDLATEAFDVTEEPLTGRPATGGRTGASQGAVPGWDEPLR